MYPVPLIDMLPTPPSQGAFGALRKHDIHTGVDLYTFEGAPVLALEDGVVVALEDFTGPQAQSPWWNATQAILIENDNGVILYGEIKILSSLSVGSLIKRGDTLGEVVPVLKKDKGKNPTSMLHLEYYDKGTRSSVWWHHNQEKPSHLRDPSCLLKDVYVSDEYCLLRKWYQNDKAKRSQVPLINHINEGLSILKDLNASQASQRAFCLHPLLQSDEDLAKNATKVASLVDPYVLLLTMEYRKTANAYLSSRTIDSFEEICLSPLKEVNDMLCADKIQNFKDFLLYHQSTHPRAPELTQYFTNWLYKLNMQDHPWIRSSFSIPIPKNDSCRKKTF